MNKWISLTQALAVLFTQLVFMDVAISYSKGRVSLSQSNFVSQAYQNKSEKTFGFISGGFDSVSTYQSEKEIPDEMQGQISGLISPSNAVMNYLNIRELYWKQLILNVGRKRYGWSLLDENFKLGVIQPLFKWNPIVPESQGLSGLFLHVEPDQGQFPWGFILMGSPLFIPNQGPGFEIKEGKFENSNPYFISPDENVEVNGKKTTLNYELDKPNTNDIIYNQSLGGMVFIGDEELGFRVSGGYFRKPNNELALGVQSKQLIYQMATEVQLKPQIYYHQVTNFRAQYALKYFAFGYEVIKDTPEEPAYPSEWTYNTYSEAVLSSPYLTMNYKSFEFGLAYLQVEGGEKIVKGPYTKQYQEVFPNRYSSLNSYLGKVGYRYRLGKNHNLGFKVSVHQGELREFEAVSATATYQWHERWAAQINAIMLTASPTDEYRRSIYHQYANNDQVGMGVSYVF